MSADERGERKARTATAEQWAKIDALHEAFSRLSEALRAELFHE